MQIELNKNTEQVLAAQAAAHGRSLNDFVAGVLSRYAEASADPSNIDKQFTIDSYEDAIAWILSRNPDLHTNRPQDTDWQALKSEGRRY